MLCAKYNLKSERTFETPCILVCLNGGRLDCLLNILDWAVVTVVCDSSDGINRLPKKKSFIHSGLINFTSDLALLFHKTGEIIKEDHKSGIDASKKRFQLLLLEKLLWAYIKTYKQKCERAQ